MEENKRITQFVELTTPQPDDVLAIVDLLHPEETKKIRFETFETSINLPYAQLSSSENQIIANTTLAYPITFNSNDQLKEIAHSETVDNSQITVEHAGMYLITFSAIAKSSLPNKSLDIWLAVDGVNIDNTNTLSRFVGSANERVITITFLHRFTVGQYFQLIMHSDDTGTSLIATAAGTDPVRPASPSIILTINKIAK